MNKTESANYIEDVSGEIIGDYEPACFGQLYNENRPQGPRISGPSSESIREQAQAYCFKLKAQYGPEYQRLYPNGMELRLW